MTQPEEDATPARGRSLTMQRIAIGRARTFAVVSIVLGAVGTVLAALLLLASRNPAIAVAQLVLWVGFIAVGVARLRIARRRLAAFEAEYGPGAGRQ